jgi:hypothetical protein
MNESQCDCGDSDCQTCHPRPLAKMDPEVKAKWVAALRSGEYDQAQSGLRVDQSQSGGEIGYCCLGVLCELYRREHPGAVWIDTGRFVPVPETGGRYNYAPPEVADWAGIDEDGDARVIDRGLTRNVSNLNDAGQSFAQIADLIEAQL